MKENSKKFRDYMKVARIKAEENRKLTDRVNNLMKDINKEWNKIKVHFRKFYKE